MSYTITCHITCVAYVLIRMIIDCILIKLTFLNNDIFPLMHFIHMRFSSENVFLIKINCIYYSHTEYSILKNNMQLTSEQEYMYKYQILYDKS